MRILLGVLGAIVLLGIVIGGSYVSAYNTANSMEQGIIAADDKSKSVLSNYGQKIREMSQVPGMLAEDLQNIITGANDSRYGGDGVSGVMTWITEQNPTLDSAVYVQLQREIAAGRTEFTNSQALLIDRVRAYETAKGSFWTGMWMRIAGYPTIDTNAYRPVATKEASDAFETREDAPAIQLR